MEFQTKRLPVARDDVAPDGSDVRVLLGLRHGGMAHFELGRSQTSGAVAHRTIKEVWFVLRGRGEMWRKTEEQEEVVPMEPGICLTIPVGTQFQFRSFGYEPLAAIAITMPPWPGEGEAYQVRGKGLMTRNAATASLDRRIRAPRIRLAFDESGRISLCAIENSNQWRRDDSLTPFGEDSSARSKQLTS